MGVQPLTSQISTVEVSSGAYIICTMPSRMYVDACNMISNSEVKIDVIGT